MYQDPFKEYIKQSEPNKRDKGYVWSIAIGLQAVDGLEPSEHLLKTAIENIEGYVTMEDAEKRISSYYETIGKREEDERTEEADKVSVRIASILSEKAFTFSPSEYIGIHKKLFWGIYKHAGKIRDVNITKKEWVLDGETVLYGNAAELRQTLEYDFEQEKRFSYQGLSQDEIIEHLAHFISRLWQIHIFGEGNTRTTAVFFIKYLRSLGYDATNNIFAENAWYFRNALVRANYTNLKKDIHETTVYLEKFIRNLLLGETNELKNRDLHINGLLGKSVGVNEENVGVKEESVGVKINKTQIKIVEFIKNNPNITIEEMAKYAGVETRTIERNIKKLKEKEIIDRIGADKNGHWIVKI